MTTQTERPNIGLKNILDHAAKVTPEDRVAGVYVLLKDYQIVFAGASNKCEQKVRTLAEAGEYDFDSYAVFQTGASTSSDTQTVLAEIVLLHRPPYNVSLPSNPAYKSKLFFKTEHKISGYSINKLTRQGRVKAYPYGGLFYYHVNAMLDAYDAAPKRHDGEVL